MFTPGSGIRQSFSDIYLNYDYSLDRKITHSLVTYILVTDLDRSKKRMAYSEKISSKRAGCMYESIHDHELVGCDRPALLLDNLKKN